jgi:hypothetical protein
MMPSAGRGGWSPGGTGGCVNTSPAEEHVYPSDLARRVVLRWEEAKADGRIDRKAPTIEELVEVLSICYHATFLHEEGRPVTFRLALSTPADFNAAAGPPSGLHRLVFTRSRPLDQHELRRIAPAAAFSRTLIGATDARGGIWGLIHSGPQWLQAVRGGRATAQVMPPVPIVAATGPGRLVVSVGSLVLAELREGRLSGGGMDVFESQWMRARLATVDRVLARSPSADEAKASRLRTLRDAHFPSVLSEHVLRRILTTVRSARHGGTLILFPDESASDLLASGRCLQLKYGVRDEEPRRRILTLTSAIADALGRHDNGGDSVVGWDTYEAGRVQRVVEMDEALFEVAHLVAELARIDGAVLLTNSLELLAFGVEISGSLPEVLRVAQALDLEATTTTWMRTDRVGTRHRSAYRLCQTVPDALALVVSQDGGLQFVRWHDQGVAYWEQIATGPLEG